LGLDKRAEIAYDGIGNVTGKVTGNFPGKLSNTQARHYANQSRKLGVMTLKEPLDRVSIKDVARVAGTSISTVSRALNDHPDVSSETRDHVLQVAKQLGYERNPFAHSLISGRSGLVAVVVYEIDNDYHLQLLRGLSRAAKNLDQELLFSFTESRQETLNTCTSIYQRGVADGALVFSPVPQDQPGLLKLQESGFPLVIIHPAQPFTGLTTVEPTDFQGSVQAMRHLVGLGHRKIGIVIESTEWGAGPGRLAGYKSVLEENGISLDDNLILVGHSGFPESGRTAARHFLDQVPDLTAVLCFNDLVAYGLIQELGREGIRVPEQMSVVGFDDIPNSRYLPPRGLTTVRQPITQIGEKALEMLVDLVDRRTKPGAHIQMPMELIIRGTTGPVQQI
jgi:LacI family transcriptional regulator